MSAKQAVAKSNKKKRKVSDIKRQSQLFEVVGWLKGADGACTGHTHLAVLVDSMEEAEMELLDNWLDEAEQYHGQEGGIPHKLDVQGREDLYEMLLRHGSRMIDDPKFDQFAKAPKKTRKAASKKG